MEGAVATESVYEGGEGMNEPVDGGSSQTTVYEQNPAEQSPKCKQLSSRELLNSSLQGLIDEINAKRKRDSSLLSDYKKALDLQCNAAYASMEASVFNTYESTNKAIEGKIQEFVETLERIAKLEAELEEFKSALSALYSDVHGP